MNTRVQLSLYVPESSAARLEGIRRLLDPVQYNLIPAHVTLCREDELEGLDLTELNAVIAASGARQVTLKFGISEVFQGHGVLLPCIEGENEFQELRRCVLRSSMVRRHAPHITLAHPRNPRSPNNTISDIEAIPSGLIITFAVVKYIRQQGSAPWQIIAKQPLPGAYHSDA